MSNFIVTSGYTKGTPYFQDALDLYKSGLKYGVYVEAIPYKSFGTWRANANYKGSLVQFALQRQSVNIVWIDADARILKYPTYFDKCPYDIAVYFVEWPIGSGKRVCSNGTIFFRNCPEVLDFVKQWAKWSMENPTKSQQDRFGQMLKASNLNWGELPPEYCMVVAPDPVPEQFKPYITKPGPIRDDVKIEDVVIMHTWGSAKNFSRRQQ